MLPVPLPSTCFPSMLFHGLNHSLVAECTPWSVSVPSLMTQKALKSKSRAMSAR